MKEARRVFSTLVSVAAAVLVATIAPTAAYARDVRPTPTGSCEVPCTHVEDCPKVSCECEKGTGFDVGACDAEKTHCCLTGSAACERFCAANHQTWTGKLGSESPRANAPTPAGKDSAAACSHSCNEAGDCPTINCQCKRGTAPNVAACDVQAKCCGEARVVCDHFCAAQKDKWTGKLLEDAPPDDAPMRDEPGAEDENETGL